MPRLKLMIREPEFTQSTIASASALGDAPIISPLGDAVSLKMGRTNSVQSGQIAGALEPRFADRIPAMKVPCLQEKLSIRSQEAEGLVGISRMFARASSEW